MSREPRTISNFIDKFIAALVCAALLVSTPGLSGYQALAQEITAAVPNSSGGGLGIPGTPIQGLSSLTDSAGRAGVELPASGLGAASIDATAAAVAAGRNAPPVARLSEPAAGTSAALKPEGRVARALAARAGTPGRAFGLFRAVIDAVSPRRDAGERDYGSSQEDLKPAASALELPSSAKEWGAGSFARLQGPAGSESAGADQAERPAAAGGMGTSRPAASLARKRGPGKLFGLAVPTGGIFLQSRAAARPAAGAQPIWGLLGQAGYLAGNILSFLFPLPQLARTFQDGHGKATPARRAVVGASASLALGAVSATVLGRAFWGAQNFFGALALIAPVFIGRWLERRGAKPMSKSGAWLATAAVSAVLAAAGVGLYFAAAAAVPALLTSFLGRAGVSVAALAVQAVSGLLFIALFVPDIADLIKKRPPKGFTSLFCLAFFAASVASLVWAAQQAAVSTHRLERLQYLIYAGLNGVYSIISFWSYRLIRRREKGPGAMVPGSQSTSAVRSAGRAVPAAPRSARGVYGVLYGTIVAAAAAPAWPLAAVLLPLVGWALGEAFLKTGKLQEAPFNPVSFWGAMAGMGTAIALGPFGPPAAFLVSLPALGAMAAFYIQGLADARGEVPEPADSAPAAPAAPDAPAVSAVPAVPAAKPEEHKWLHEDFFGNRSVHGIEADPSLGPLPLDADAARVIRQISVQFSIPMERIRGLAENYGLPMDGKREAWLAVYDLLQSFNREEFIQLDQKKDHDGAVGEALARLRYAVFRRLPGRLGRWLGKPPKEAGFRKLAGKSYPPGWRGIALRMAQFWKHVLGPVRVVYGLFDMFLFGYFRRSIGFQWRLKPLSLRSPWPFRSRVEDFLNVAKPGRADEYLEAAMSAQSWRPKAAAWRRLKAAPAARFLDRFFIKPLAAPLFQFLLRRGSMAVFSAAAMGILAGFAPFLPLSFSFLSIPWLGHAVQGLAHGLPLAAAHVPYVGAVLSLVLGRALSVLIGDLMLGPLLNTMILSTMLTFPAALKRSFMDERQERLFIPPFFSKEYAFGALKTFFGWTFWKRNWSTFFGLMTVGAEIEGVMTFAGAADAGLSPASEALFGRKFKVFKTFGEAVERPKDWRDDHGVWHHNALPFGGAINWGNVLLYKLQNAAGFNITDFVFQQVNGVIEWLRPNDVTRGMQGLAGPSGGTSVAASVVSMAENKDAREKAGSLKGELAAAKADMARLQDRLSIDRRRLAELQAGSKPVTAQERAEYDKLLKELSDKRGQGYIESKLSQLHDLKNPAPEDLAQLRKLKELQDYYQALLPPPNADPGYKDSLGGQVAALKTIQDRLEQLRKGERTTRKADIGTGYRIDEATSKKLADLAGELEQLRLEAKAAVAEEVAGEKLLSVAGRARNAALRDRRPAKAMKEFHENLARLATVMDLAFALNEIGAAQTALLDMQKLLDGKLQGIRQAGQAAAANQRQALQNKGQVDQWRADANKTLADDAAQRKDMVRLEGQSAKAVQEVRAFRTGLGALLERLDAEDGGGAAGGAPVEYARRLALLATLVDRRTNGKPGDPDYHSLKDFQKQFDDAGDLLKKIDDGMGKLDTTPDEFAGVLIAEVPNKPEVVVHSPSPDVILGILADRKVYWQGQFADYRKQLTDNEHRLDRDYGGTETNDFGEPNPVSLPKWLLRDQGYIADAQGELKRLAADIDALAAHINRVSPGASLPPLSGLVMGKDIEGLKAAMESYSDKLSAVHLPSDDTDDVFQAQMDFITLGKLLPEAGRATIKWAKYDTEARSVQDAQDNTLPPVVAGLRQVVAAVGGIISDIDADAAYVNSGPHNGQSQKPVRQALIDRKRTMLINLRSALEAARGFLNDQLIPFQKDGIKTVQPGGDKYAKLFNSQVKLYNATKKALDRTLPWALASNGAPDGDVPAALAGIQRNRDKFNKFLQGYNDPDGTHHKGIAEYQLEIKQRADPAFLGTESLYGEIQPFSLPRKISLYGQEKVRRAAQIDAQDAEINGILAKIDQRTGGKFGLVSGHSLPTGIDGSSPAGVARIQAAADHHELQNLGDLLQQIGDRYKVLGGDPSLGAAADGIPVGAQPPPTLNNELTVAFLALQAGRRLVPSTQQGPQDSSTAYAVARFLFADAVVSAAKKALEPGGQLDAAQAFVDQGAKALGDALDYLKVNEAYARSNGAGEPGSSVLDRFIATYSELHDFTRSGMDFFGLKAGWDQDSLKTLDKVGTYYDSVGTLYGKGATVDDSELLAINQMKAALQKKFDDLETSRGKYAGWLSQLNPPLESASKRPAESMSGVQELTKMVLERNFDFHRLEEDHERARETARWALERADEKQRELEEELDKLQDPGALPAGLAYRVQGLQANGGAWMLPDAGDASQAVVVKKSNFGYFLDKMFAALRPSASGQNLAILKRDLLNNPRGLSDVIPNSEVIDFGDDADGFYLVYQTQFSVPHGLQTESSVTMGNVAKIAGNNVSFVGYNYASPANNENAPWGDKGVGVQVESIQGKNWVNYLNVDLHRFISSYPNDTLATSQAAQSRMLVFDDFAMLLFGDKLYVAATGFGDWALADAANKPSYYGGSFKTSVKFNEVMRLNAQQQRTYAEDPRKFMQDVNLDFTDYDKFVNKDFSIRAAGAPKNYTRTELGSSFDVARLLDSPNAFNVDLFFARQRGTDDYDQDSVGISVLNGFTIRDAGGKPWLAVDNRAGAEVGQAYNTFSDRVSVSLPNQGYVFSAEGRLVGDAKTYYLEAGKKLGDHASLNVGYGTRYVGLPNRLTLSLNTAFTLGELWKEVFENSAKDLSGGSAAEAFDKGMDEFFADREPKSKTAAALKAVYMQDVGRKLLSQDMGRLSRDVEELRKAGAIMDNTRIRGMIGFVSNPVGDALADRIVGGGPTAGAFTELTLDKTQKALIGEKIQELYQESLRLQARMLELTKDWQAAVEELAEAQWDLKLARFAAENAGTQALRLEGEVGVGKAQLRLDEALIAYNSLTGRGQNDPFPFDGLDAGDLKALVAELKKTVEAPDRLTRIFHDLDPGALKAKLGKNSFNIVDWLPFIDRLSLSIGVQLPDVLANQALGINASIRLPVYDPASKARDKSYELKSAAAVEAMGEVRREYGLKARQELDEAAAAEADAKVLAPQVGPSAEALAYAVAGRRNGLVGEAELREAFSRWRWYAGGALAAEGRAALAAGWSRMDASFAKTAAAGGRPAAVRSLPEALAAAWRSSGGVAEAAYREQAAAALAEADARRVQKVYADISIGTGLTADGVAWWPAFGFTGFGVTPIVSFELKPEELEALQVRAAKGEEDMYKNLKTQVEIDLAVRFYENAVLYKNSEKAAAILENDVLPRLLQARGGARARLAGGRGSASDLAKAQKDLDEGNNRLTAARLANGRARSTLNYLLGRAADAPLVLDLTPEAALADLKAVLAEKDPVGTSRKILADRARIAEAEQEMADNDLKVSVLRFDAVSLVERSLLRFITALSDEGIGNPDLAAATKAQALQARWALKAYDKGLGAKLARARSELSSAEQQRDAASGDDGPFGAVERLEQSSKVSLLEAELAGLGSAGRAAPPGTGAPSSFAELSDRVLAAEQGREVPEPPARLLEPRTDKPRSAGMARYWYAKQSLGKDPIGKGYVEGMLTARLRSQDAPPEVMAALSDLEAQTADAKYRNAVEEARMRGNILVARFKERVRLMRWVRAKERSAGGAPASRSLSGMKRELARGLEADASELAALLGLPAGVPPEALERLVPSAPGGDDDVRGISESYLAEVDALNVEYVRRTIFQAGVPESFGNKDALMQQLKADVIARRMSYRGVTPVAAFGLFRGVTVGGGFFEAPDPRSIEQELTNVLSESLRKELVSQGRMKELALRLELLMTGVRGDAKLLERQERLIAAAQDGCKAALAAFDRGMASAEDLAASQEALARAWLDFTRTAAELKSGFIELETELEAAGYKSKSRFAPSAGRHPAPEDSSGPAPLETVLDFWSRRMLDESFARRFDSLLGGLKPGLDYALREELARAAADYRLMSEDAQQVRRAREIAPLERLELLAKGDVEGRRLQVRALLGRAVASLGRLDPNANPAWAALLKFLAEDAKAQTDKAELTRQGERQALDGLRDAYWHAVPASHAVEGAYRRLAALHADKEAARQRLLEESMMRLKAPSDFIMRDLALDRYLKAEEAFDAELIADFDSKEGRADLSSMKGLDALFDLRAAVARQKDRVRFGRGVEALNALIMLQEGRLAALRWELALPSQVEEAALALARLKEMKERWSAKSPDGLQALYAVVEAAAAGRGLSTIRGWHTQKELDAWLESGEVQKGKDGRLWLIPSEAEARAGASRQEVVSGVDIAEAGRDKAAAAREANGRVLDLAELFKSADFALVGPDGAARRGLGYEEMFAAGRNGRLFYFAAAPDLKSGLRPAMHPLEALWAEPQKSEAFVYIGGRPLARDRFPTRESLDDYLDRLRRSSDPEDRKEADAFLRLEAGPGGVERMSRAARLAQVQSQRAGWMSVKLNSYGFAMNEKGDLAQTFLTREEFEAAMKALRGAKGDLAEAKAAVGPLKAEAARLEREEKVTREEADAENIRYLAVRKLARERLRSPRPDMKSDELDSLVAKDQAFRKAQEGMSGKAKAADKAREAALDARRRLDEAERDVREAGRMLKRSETWSLYESRDVVLTLDSKNALVGVDAGPVFGGSGLQARFGRAEGRLSRVRGEIMAAVMDKDQNLARVYLDEDAVEKAAAHWTLEEVNGVRWTAQGREIDPNFRLKQYVDPQAGRDASGKPAPLPVMLNRRYMIERLKRAGGDLTFAKYWGVEPRNWVNLLLELPRGVLKTPLEFAGRDMTKEGYEGGINARKTEGGSQEHHGFIRRVLGALDVLELFPDPVDRAFDPGQFPEKVRLDSPIGPGQNIYDKDAAAGDKDWFFGVKHVERTIRYETEDVLNAKQRTYSYFEGGVSKTVLADRRGRDREYQTSSVSELEGRKALEEALQDPAVAAADDPVGRGASRDAAPDALEVDRVVIRTFLRPGARLSAATAALLEKYLGVFRSRETGARQAEPALKAEAARAQADYARSLDGRDAAYAEEKALWAKFRPLAWRIGEQEALEAEAAAVRADIELLRNTGSSEEARVRELEGRLLPPASPGRRAFPIAPGSWQWLAAGAALAGLLGALLRRRLRRRGRRQS